jgi:heme a synthase
MAGVVMLMIQVLLGGITRLTGSGLSITRWDVVVGAFPPLNQQQWMEKFHLYQLTPQYRLLNSDFTLSNFKFIFFWEWFHRFWARTMFVVYLIPFVIFVWNHRIRQDMIIPLLVLVVLGAMQGMIGWIMVSTGLEGDAIHVSPGALAVHFICAMVLICYTFWFGMQLLISGEQRFGDPGLQRWTLGLLLLLAIQLTFGAFMAGNKAAQAASTWPSINGAFWPSGVWSNGQGMLNFVENKITIHFIHRSLAYLIFLFTVLFAWRASRRRPGIPSSWAFLGTGFAGTGTPLFIRTYWIPMLLVTIQVLLGIGAVLFSTDIHLGTWGVFEWTAQFHQLVGMFLVLSILYIYYLVSGRVPGKA